MAKKVYPGAAFEPCDNEAIPFVFDLFAQISLPAPLPIKAKENLEKCSGAMRLRRFKQNELICRQGEEDCTAFYILKTDDIESLCQYPQKRTQQTATELAAAEKKMLCPVASTVRKGMTARTRKRARSAELLSLDPSPVVSHALGCWNDWSGRRSQ